MSEYVVEFGDKPINDDNEFIHERITRCSDCMFFTEDELGQACTQFDFGFAFIAIENGFCSWAVKRDD